MNKKALTVCTLLSSLWAGAQTTDIQELNQEYLNWHLKTPATSQEACGTAVQRAYEELLASKSPKKQVVVAVIDSGIDTLHTELKGHFWINEDEIPGNGIDDDNNGYIDDINGWGFLGNAKGENINDETFEYVRIIRDQDETYPEYAEIKAHYVEELKNKDEEQQSIVQFIDILTKAKQIIRISTGVDVKSAEDLKRITSGDQRVAAAKAFLEERYEMGFNEEMLTKYEERLNESLLYHLNMDFDPRGIAGDDPYDITDTNYGNPDIMGPRANHGTGVSGVIVATRNNNIGIDGVADVKIMGLRAVPNGDERDKDIALAIRYAVDNGADIINMSFGKDYSPNKEWVDEAFKYAEANNVLLVHAAGNDGKDIDLGYNYPSDIMNDGTEVNNCITVGASTKDLDENILATFSNYGKIGVDFFAPGSHIITLDTANQYNDVDGTSFAAPLTSGIAALVLTYYPELSAAQLKEVLIESCFTFKQPKKVLIPGEDDKKQKIKKLAKQPGIVNAYNALLLAEKITKKS